jgi:hypothetical protein
MQGSFRRLRGPLKLTQPDSSSKSYDDMIAGLRRDIGHQGMKEKVGKLVNTESGWRGNRLKGNSPDRTAAIYSIACRTVSSKKCFRVTALTLHIVLKLLPGIRRPIARHSSCACPYESPVYDQEVFDVVLSDGHNFNAIPNKSLPVVHRFIDLPRCSAVHSQRLHFDCRDRVYY